MNFVEKLDTYKHKGLRKKLVESLAAKGITSQKVLDAMQRIPRHIFIGDSALDHFIAYEDRAFQIGAGQTISHPYTVAFQTELLDVASGEKVLEVGTGSGYQTSVLCELGARVFSIERQKLLYDKTKILMGQMGYGCKLFLGDGYKGLPSFAPFDKIIVTAGAPFIPEQLVAQLKVGGKMVIPVGDQSGQTMTTLRKISDTENELVEYNKFNFVPLLEKTVLDHPNSKKI